MTEAIPRRFRFEPRRDIQVITPMQRGQLGARALNVALQTSLNPTGPAVQRYGWTFRVGDRVMQTVNNYEIRMMRCTPRLLLRQLCQGLIS